MLAPRHALVFASAIACLLTPACMGKTQERPLRSAAAEAPRAWASSASSVPFPDTAFRPPAENDNEAPRSRFETRRISEAPAPSRRYHGATVDLDLKNADLAKMVAGEVKSGPAFVYLGDPVAIKEPTAAVFRAQSAANCGVT